MATLVLPPFCPRAVSALSIVVYIRRVYLRFFYGETMRIKNEEENASKLIKLDNFRQVLFVSLMNIMCMYVNVGL